MAKRSSDTLTLYVYQHRRSDTNEIFYIGIGKRERAFDYKGRSSFWKSITSKTDFITEIVLADIPVQEAKEVEKYLIKFYGRRDLGLGPLVNMTDGGDGAFGKVVSEQTKRKQREANLGSKNPMYGKTTSNETKAKLSKINKGQNNPMFGKVSAFKGKKHSQETIDKIKKSQKGKPCKTKGIKLSEETKSKMSEAKKLYWATRKALN